ncbi:MAG: ribosome small subunit-dependent GTPase A [Gemmatimonadota bacterium]|nr:ribosome small subunit-dependent GTPase A [Gemmatimonadota bacterium]
MRASSRAPRAADHRPPGPVPADQGNTPVTIDNEAAALAALGWDSTFADAFAPFAAEGLGAARVVAEHRDRYVLAGALSAETSAVLAGALSAETSAVLAGRLRHDARSRLDLPAVGDWVAATRASSSVDVTSIHAVLPRRTAFVRKMAGDETAAQVVAANVDVALVMTALPDDVNVRRLERYLALAWESGALPVVLLTKADLSEDVAAHVAAAQSVAPGVDVIALSSVTGDGVGALARLLRPGRTAVLLGPSGAGKSTLANRLLSADHLRTADVRADGKGRHTTTHRELVRLSGGALLIDTPGMRELQLWDADGGLGAAFADIYALAAECHFRDCRHETEPGCAVRAAVDAGRLPAERLEHWRQLQRELAHLARRQDELAAAADRSRTKSLQRLLREHLRRKYR